MGIESIKGRDNLNYQIIMRIMISDIIILDNIEISKTKI